MSTNSFVTSPGLKLLHLNCRSIYRKLDQIILLYKECDIICFSETWLTTSLGDQLLHFPGKLLYRQDRRYATVDVKGGGLCIYADIKYGPYCAINADISTCTPDFELLCLDVKKPGNRHMSVICMYRPPKGKHIVFQDYLENILKNLKTEIWILGDINVDFLNRDDENRAKYLRIFKKYGLRQYIEEITRPNTHGGTCIDWIVSNSDFVRSAGVASDFISDHFTTFIIRKKDRENNKFVYRTLRDLSNFDADIFKNLLRNENWEHFDNSDNVQELWTIYYKKVYDILAIMCPLKRYKQREIVTPWLTPEIYRAMRERDKFINLFKISRLPEHLVKARQHRNRVNSLVCKAKGNYIKTQLNQNSKNPKKFWRIIKDLTKPKFDMAATARFIDPTTNIHVDIGSEANFLNNYYIDIVRNLNIPVSNASMLNVYNLDTTFCFLDNLPTEHEIVKIIKEIDVNKSSCVENINSKFCKESMLSVPDKVCYMITKSLTTGEIPSDWTAGIINVIPKDGDLLFPSNWRPITQTSMFAKILEKIVHIRLLKYFLDNDIISNHQFGFLPGRSTQLAVFELVKQIYSTLNNKKLFGSICLDISKAFDCIDHTKLFEKMISCGFSEVVMKWFRSYFSRTQCVRFNYIVSDILPVASGIGQGTILGPLVFIFYINDVTRNIGNLRINMYADDCLIYCTGNNWNNMRPKIDHGLECFLEWCTKNRLKLNARKSKSLLIGSYQKINTVDFNDKFTSNNQELNFTNTYNYLGIYLDKNMTLIPLLSKLKSRVVNKIYLLVKIRNMINTHCAIAIYKQTILPILDYSGFLLIACNKSDRSDLQKLQNHALRICFNVRLRDRVSTMQMHARAGLLSLEQRRQKQLLCLMFIHKQRHNVARVHGRMTRAAQIFSFVRERYNCIKYKNSSYYKGALLWDSLPIITRNSNSLLEFKRHLKISYRNFNNHIA